MGILDGLSRVVNNVVDDAEDVVRDAVQAGERVVQRVVDGVSDAASAGSSAVGSTSTGGGSSSSAGSAVTTSKGLPIASMRPRPRTSRGLAVSRFFSGTLPTSKGLLIPSMAPRVPSSKGLPIPSMVPVVPTSKGLPILSMRPRADRLALHRAMANVDRTVRLTNRVAALAATAGRQIEEANDGGGGGWNPLGGFKPFPLLRGGVNAAIDATAWTGNAAWDAGGYGLRAATGTSRVLDVPGSMAANVAYLATTPKSMLTPLAYVNNNLGDPIGLDAKMQFVNDVATAGGVLRRLDFGPDAMIAGRLFRRADAIGTGTAVYKLDRDTYKFWHRQGSDAEDVAMGWVGLTPGVGEAIGVLDLWARSRKPWEIAGPRMEYDSFLDMLRGDGRLVVRAGGGRVGHGETTLVGERGPEIVRLPAGSDVIPAHRSRELLQQAATAPRGGRRDLHIHQQLDGREIARSTIRNLDDDEQWGRR